MADGSFPPAPAPFSDAEIDVHVGARLKARRKSVGLSQKALAAQLRVAFQQVQKYETGENRMSCAKLFACAGALGWTANDFFVGLPELAAAAALDPSRRRPASAPGHLRRPGARGRADRARDRAHRSPLAR